MDQQPKPEKARRVAYFGEFASSDDIERAGKWMWAQDFSGDDIAIIQAYIAKRPDQNLGQIAQSLEVSEDRLHDLLDRAERLVREAIDATKKHKNEIHDLVADDESLRKRGLAVLEIAAAEKIHPSKQNEGTIRNSDRYACKDLKPSKRDKFTSKSTKDQQEAARRCLHCEIRKKCGQMAIEQQFANAVYGGMTGKQLGEKIRADGRTEKKAKKDKKKKKK